MLKIVKVWCNIEYRGDWILQFYSNIYTPLPSIEGDVPIIWDEKGFQLR